MDRTWTMEGGGTLRAREEGLWIHLAAERPDDGRGLYKVWCAGAGGSVLLGTLVPQGGRLSLTRRVARRTLEEEGAWPLTGGKTVMVYSFTERNGGAHAWHREDHPEEFCRDIVVRGCLRGAQGLLSRERAGGRELAAPFSTCKSILLNTLFCLARVERWGGRAYLVWRFDQNGEAVVPPGEK